MGLLKDFADPPAEFRPAPFWFWNHDLELDELERQILDMKAKGLGGFIMHARHGLLTPYLGEAWMQAVEHCSRVAQREKMWAWLYDEDNWPSGTVGMRMLREHPEFRMSQLVLTDEIDLARGELCDRDLKIIDELYCVLSVPVAADGTVALGREKDITRRVKDGHIQHPGGRRPEKVLVFCRVWSRMPFGGCAPDYLNRHATQWFLQETHDKYAARLKPLLGRSVKGIFMDEPSTFYSRQARSIQYTDELPRRFEKDHRLKFIWALPALFFPAGNETAKVRVAFLETVKAMYKEAFFKPIYDWAERHKVRSIGHVNNEGEFADQVKQHGDYFATVEHMHYAGIDALFDATFFRPGMPNNHLACKFASSAEHLLEKERTMCEAFGVADGWELSLPTLKWLGDFQAVCGVNYFMPHAAYYSVAGFRKWECPPDQSYHTSYWPFYKPFADHLARLSVALSGGRHIAPVALLSPTAGMAAALNPVVDPTQFGAKGGENPASRAIHDALGQAAEALSRHQLDFDLVNEEILSRGRVNSDRELEIHGRKGRVLERFRYLVLPHVTVLSRATVERLEAWAAAGLPIVFLDTLPDASAEKGLDEDAASRLKKLTERPNVCLAPIADAAFIKEITSRIVRDVEIDDVRDLLYLLKENDGRQVLLLANTSRDRGYDRLKVRVRVAGVPHVMDTRTGDVRLLPCTDLGDGRLELELDFPPAASLLILFARKRVTRESVGPRLANVEGSRLVLADSWRFAAEGGNYFPLRRWRYDLSTETHQAERKFYSYRKTWRAEFHAAVNPAKAMLLADGLFDQRSFTNDLRLGVEVAINGHPLTDWHEGTHYDRLVLETDVTSLVRQGMNEVVISNQNNFNEGLNHHQPMYLVGDFTVAGQGEHEVVSVQRSTLQTGSWASQGFPYFSGIGRYEQEFDLPARLADQRVFLEFEHLAHVAEVIVNGQPAGTVLWPPRRLDVSGLLRPGRNHLAIRVANTMANVFILRPDESGLVGKVSLLAKQPMA
jgi:hypothetical protein